MSRATQQTGRYRMRYCVACGTVFTFDNIAARRDRRTLCPECRKHDATLRAEDATFRAKDATLRVENRGRIPGGNIRWGARR
jgi:ribosomal protein L37AE/L43A